MPATRRLAAVSRTWGSRSGPKLKADAAGSDARLLDRLAEVREAIDDIPRAQTEAAYAAEFRAAGLVPDARTPEETGRAIARRPARTAVELAVALDHWAGLRFDQGDRSGAPRITAAARAADPDDFRGRLRRALMEPSAQARRAALRDLARSTPAAELPPVTSALLGAGLLHAGDPITAESVLRSAQRRHPADPWLAQILAKTLEKQSRPAEAIRYYYIARAARPESAHALAHALERQGERTEAIAVFREAIRLNPGSARHLGCLAKALKSQGQVREAELVFDAAVAAGCKALGHAAGERPLHHALVNLVVCRPDRLDDIIAAYRNAIRQRPHDGATHFYLGCILARTGRTDDAIAEYREAIRLKPDFAEAHTRLGLVLSDLKRDHIGAVTVFRDLIRLRADDPLTHFNLGYVLRAQGRLDEAIAEYRAAIRLKPDFSKAFCNLGEILCSVESNQDEGRAALLEAIRLEPDDAFAHYNLASSLRMTGRLDEAAAEYRDSIRLEPRLATAHYGLGSVLNLRGRAGEAMAEYRETLRLKPDFAEAHCDLAYLLRNQGKYDESLVAGYELRCTSWAPRLPDWSYPSKQWVAQARRLARLAPKFAAMCRGEARPADAAECVDLALVASGKGLHAMAARLYAEAVAADPSLAQDLEAPDRYNAACSAALAGCGKGKDQPSPDLAARGKLRRQALDWLGRELEMRSRIVASGSGDAGPAVRRSLIQKLEHWKRDADLAGVREVDALQKLDPAEQAAWRAFWAEVDRVLSQLAAASD